MLCANITPFYLREASIFDLGVFMKSLRINLPRIAKVNRKENLLNTLSFPCLLLKHSTKYLNILKENKETKSSYRKLLASKGFIYTYVYRYSFASMHTQRCDKVYKITRADFGKVSFIYLNCIKLYKEHRT